MSQTGTQNNPFMDNMLDFEKVEADRLRQEEAPEPSFTEDELNSARQIANNEGIEQGRKEGIKEAQLEREEQLLSLCNNFASQIENLLSQEQIRTRESQKQTIEIGIKLAKNLFPALANKGIITEIETLISSRLTELQQEPHLILHLHPNLKTDLKERLEQHPLISPHIEKIHFMEDETQEEHSCKLEWQNGGISYNIEDFWIELDKIKNNILGSTEDIQTKEPTEQSQQPQETDITDNTDNTEYNEGEINE